MSVSLIDGHIDSDAPGMTDKQIIKALECHSNDYTFCMECPFTNKEECSCELSRNALDLINCQKAEIERLKDFEKNVYEAVEELRNKIKAEAVKEFAERFIQEDGYNNHTFDDCASILVPEEYRKGREEKTKEVWELIEKIKKEMVGDG